MLTRPQRKRLYKLAIAVACVNVVVMFWLFPGPPAYESVYPGPTRLTKKYGIASWLVVENTYDGPSALNAIPVYRQWYVRPAPLASTLLFSAGFAAVMVLIYRRKTARIRRRDQLCDECGYDLRASESRCPECGAPIQLAQ